MSGVRIKAPAKVNLSLQIGARRDDGFHEIDTLFQAIESSSPRATSRESSSTSWVPTWVRSKTTSYGARRRRLWRASARGRAPCPGFRSA